MDEFYSWVYAQKCTYAEILTLKDTGIGHPPLYHLIQKFVSDLLPGYHFVHVRIANFIFGILFLWVIFQIIGKNGKSLFFIVAFSMSAAMINTFVFSRMWGLVSLFAALVLWQGEEYVRNRKKVNLFLLTLFFLTGYLADYSTVLLFPYVILVLFSRNKYLKTVVYLVTISLLILYMGSLIWVASKDHNILFGFYLFFKNFSQVSEQIYVMLFNWEFHEFQYISLFLFFVGFLFFYRQKKLSVDAKHGFNILLISWIFFFLTFMQLLFESEIIRVRISAFLISLILIIIIFYFKIYKNFNFYSANSRFLLGIFLAILILFAVSPVFWRSLVDARFLTIMLPFIFYLLYKVLHSQVLNHIGILFIISGLLFVLSNRIENFYVAPSLDTTNTIIYQDAGAYSTQYLKKENAFDGNPYFLDLSSFTKSCRVCQMGTRKIPYENLTDFYLIAKNNFKYSEVVPAIFDLILIKQPNFSLLDKFLINFLRHDTWTGYQLFYFKRMSNDPI